MKDLKNQPCINPDKLLHSLNADGLSLFFEGRIQDLKQQLQDLTFTPDTPPPLRIALLQVLLQQDSEAQLDEFYTLFLTGNDLEACCACVGGAIFIIWGRGNNFKNYTPWLERAETLIKRAENIPAQASSYLFLQKGTAEMTGPGNLAEAERCFGQQRQLAERAQSTSLQVIGAAMHAYCFIWSGKLVRADLVLQQATPLLSDSQICKVCITYYQVMLAIIKTIQGEPQQAVLILEKIINQPLFLQLPSGLRLRVFNFLLNTEIVADHLIGVEKIAEQIRTLAIPEQNNFHRNYLNFCLGIAALTTGRPHKANIHAEEATLRATACGSTISIYRTALLQGRVLTNLGKDSDALQHFDIWDTRWQEGGYHLMSALGRLEIAAIYLSQGLLDKARIHWDRAHELIPLGEKMFHLFRPKDFYEDLEKRLLQPQKTNFKKCHHRVCIETLGGFSLNIDGKKLYDRNWKGRQTKKLLKALVVYGGQKVSADKLAMLLWPDSEGDLAANSLDVTLTRLRCVGAKTGQKPLRWLVSQHKNISLIGNLCHVDALVFRDQIKKALLPPQDPELLQSTLDLYTGNFLPDDSIHIWVDTFRKELQQLYTRGVQRLAEKLSGDNKISEVIALLEQALTYDPIDEALYLKLMQTHLKNNNRGKALEIYERATKILSAELGTTPDTDLQALALKARAS